MRITRKATLAVGVGSVAAAALLTSMAGVANADPTSTPPATSIVAVGSDTTQALFNKLSTDYNATSPAKPLYSFDATPAGSTITPKTGCAAITRPNGSGAGITALQQNARPSGDTTNYCIDIARSSRTKNTTTDTGLAFVPFAQDAVTWSKTNRSGAPSNAPTSLSKTELKAIYNCDASLVGGTANTPVKWNQVGGTSTANVLPVLPQASSGTRSFFLSAIGVTTPGSCVSTTTPEENEGTDAIFSSASSPNIVFPYSIAVFLAQSQNGHGTGNQGNQVLGSAENSSGTAVSPTSGSAGALVINAQLAPLGLTRNVFNVVRDTGASTHVPAYLQPLLGKSDSSGWLCSNATAQADITSYGFKNISTCGVV